MSLSVCVCVCCRDGYRWFWGYISIVIWSLNFVFIVKFLSFFNISIVIDFCVFKILFEIVLVINIFSEYFLDKYIWSCFNFLNIFYVIGVL